METPHQHKVLIDIFNRNPQHLRVYLAFYLCLLAAGISFSLLYPRGTEIYWINSLSGPRADAFFKYFTHAGDGITCAVIGVVLMIFRFGHGLFWLISYALSGLTAQALKRIFPLDRPSKFLPDFAALHPVEGVELHGHHSFPSGHTTTAFAMAFAAAILCRNKVWSVTLLFLAALVGISRMYLLQHFLTDVVAGSLLGTGWAMWIWYIFSHSSLNEHPIMNFSLINRNGN